MSAITVTLEMESVKTRFKNIRMADDSDRFLGYMEGRARDFNERLPLAHRGRILNVGCGSGQLALLTTKDGLEVIGWRRMQRRPFEHPDTSIALEPRTQRATIDQRRAL